MLVAKVVLTCGFVKYVLVGVVVGSDGLGAFLEATWAQVCGGDAGGAGGGPEATDGGGGGAAELMVLRREAFSRSPTLVMRVATFSTRAGLLWKVGGGGRDLACLWGCLTWVDRDLICWCWSFRIDVRAQDPSEKDLEFPGLNSM